jgi:hypothetical protein
MPQDFNIGDKAEFYTWVSAQLRKLTIDDQERPAITGDRYLSIFDNAQCIAASLGLHDVVEVLGARPPAFASGGNETYLSGLRGQIRAKLERIRPLLTQVQQHDPTMQPRSTGNVESVAEETRRLAERIANLADDVIRSFAFSSANDRVRDINRITGEIVHDALQLITWIERNRPLAAGLEKRRLLQMEIEAERCASLDIPEYAGGVVSRKADGERTSLGARRTAELFVFCNAFGRALLEWANEIEGISGASSRPDESSLAIPELGPSDNRFIFVSYATPDLASVDAIVQLLDSAGLRTWFDKKDLSGGQDWEYEIRKKLEAASLTLICLSTHAVDRKGFFHKEMRYAVEEALKLPKDKVFIMPVRLNDCPIPDDIRRWHTLNLFERSSSKKLLQSIGTALHCDACAPIKSHEAFETAMKTFNAS